MPDSGTLAVFALAGVIFAVIPGPAVFYVVTRSVAQGRKAGVVSAVAIETGNLVHVAAATIGLSALLAASAVAFTTVKYLGAAYLIYLGVRTLLNHRDVESTEADALPTSTWRVFRDGVVVSVLNPKTAIFFLSFLPQFVDPSRGPAALQVAALGILLMMITAVSDMAYALLTGTAGVWLKTKTRAMRNLRLATGGAYIALGVAAALTGDRSARG